MENPIKMDDLGGKKTHYFWKHPYVFPTKHVIPKSLKVGPLAKCKLSSMIHVFFPTVLQKLRNILI